ncbi:DUF6884 domain-containing protein [Nodularia chucula]|uniref:DUF6884 domain-containing protein n=1 Tax=Nodularia chucula TaxID=3093667 RepID=UPI0039C5F490
MKKIVLISCVSKKLTQRAKAKDLYISTLFKLNLQFARQCKPDFIFILSAKYGLLNLDDEIDPYEMTLNKMSREDRTNWSAQVVRQLGSQADLIQDHFIILAGEKYRQFILPMLCFYEIPLKGLPIGKQLQQLKRSLKNG